MMRRTFPTVVTPTVDTVVNILALAFGLGMLYFTWLSGSPLVRDAPAAFAPKVALSVQFATITILSMIWLVARLRACAGDPQGPNETDGDGTDAPPADPRRGLHIVKRLALARA